MSVMVRFISLHLVVATFMLVLMVMHTGTSVSFYDAILSLFWFFGHPELYICSLESLESQLTSTPDEVCDNDPGVGDGDRFLLHSTLSGSMWMLMLNMLDEYLVNFLVEVVLSLASLIMLLVLVLMWWRCCVSW
ncbi:hypothetical protein BDK51DRAFT_29086 [Blyttiomyces helicus]|uniref:Uncharacterized protein n=1 Tax=Blyttiomyces helicus TaxID=388810 RepID=A0A4P9W417_9FUNG|nr:hypothetical protein BDK51DRAFT_29086 [Blyttiomyces helicus]|eukprot:RKO87079.1 hypothetical protein BDK51DRAFT_29086 [Blyttiomyces helicus]